MGAGRPWDVTSPGVPTENSKPAPEALPGASEQPASWPVERSVVPDDHPSMPDLALIVNLLSLAAKDRTQLVLDNIALRHQLAV